MFAPNLDGILKFVACCIAAMVPLSLIGLWQIGSWVFGG